ncbi:MAG: DMT family transporter [Coriobacteriales bacterium]|nr:DMT family transporter [Coriobacteriales bacterium]
MPKTLKASLLIGFAGALYGVMLTVMQIANNHGYLRVDLMACQFLFSAAVFFVAILVKYRSVRLKGTQRLKLLLIGLFGFGTNFCMYETVALSSSSFAVTMLFQYIWMGIVFDALVTKKVPPWYMILAVVLVFVGTPLAAGLFDAEHSINPLSLLTGLGASTSYTGMLWTSARLETKVSPVIRTFYFSAAQASVAILIAPQTFIVSVIDPGVWLYAIPLGLTTAVVPTFLVMRNAPKVPVGITTIMTGMELPSTIVLSALVLQQAHSAVVVVGVVLICLGIVVANKDGIDELRRPRQSRG